MAAAPRFAPPTAAPRPRAVAPPRTAPGYASPPASAPRYAPPPPGAAQPRFAPPATAAPRYGAPPARGFASPAPRRRGRHPGARRRPAPPRAPDPSPGPMHRRDRCAPRYAPPPSAAPPRGYPSPGAAPPRERQDTTPPAARRGRRQDTRQHPARPAAGAGLPNTGRDTVGRGPCTTTLRRAAADAAPLRHGRAAAGPGLPVAGGRRDLRTSAPYRLHNNPASRDFRNGMPSPGTPSRKSPRIDPAQMPRPVVDAAPLRDPPKRFTYSVDPATAPPPPTCNTIYDHPADDFNVSPRYVSSSSSTTLANQAQHKRTNSLCHCRCDRSRSGEQRSILCDSWTLV